MCGLLDRNFFPFLLKKIKFVSRDPKNYSKISEKWCTKPSPILIDILRNNQHQELNLCDLQFPQEWWRVPKNSEASNTKMSFISWILTDLVRVWRTPFPESENANYCIPQMVCNTRELPENKSGNICTLSIVVFINNTNHDSGYTVLTWRTFESVDWEFYTNS